MKAQLKKKIDAKIMGNKKITLSPWEEELYKLIQGDDNPTISKMSCSMPSAYEFAFQQQGLLLTLVFYFIA